MKTHTLLAVDDRAENLFVLKQLFAEHLPECGLVTAQSAEEGLALAAERSFDGALIDVQMPDVDGLEMCRRLKADGTNGHLPILLITAHGSTAELRVRGLEAGADDFISRPIDNVELVTKIRVMLRIKRAEDELRTLNARMEDLVIARTRQLQESEERYRLHFENASDIIYSIDPEFRFLSVSPSVEKILGYRPEELIGKPFAELNLLAPEYLEEALSDSMRVFAGERISSKVYEFIAKDGSRRFGELSSVPIFRDGKVVAIVSVARDVTERKRGEEELRGQMRLNQILLDAMPCIALLIRPQTREMVASNKAAAKVGAMPGKRCFATWGQRDDPCPWCRAPKLWATGEAQHLEVETLDAVWDAHWIPVSDDLYLYYAFDITDQKKAEHELTKAKEAAEAASRVKSQFLANMSHEIRTPMTAIMGYTDLLLSHEWPPDERREHLQVVSRQSQHLLAIIDDILDLSKIESQEIELQLTECSVSEIVEEVQSLLQVNANEKQLGLDIHYRQPLPRTIRTDANRLRQILVNLVGNAVKFTEQGGVKITVGCTRQEDGSARMQFKVADTGIGIRSEEIDRLFQPFTQADMNFSRRFGGTGLGLAISQRLAQLLGGRIEVESQPGKGSVFLLTIDAGPPDNLSMAQSPDARRMETRPPTQQRPGQRLTGFVLLAEDDPDLQALLERNLLALGLEVDTAENGRIAYEKALASRARGRPYDLILMDIQMPELDGHEATGRLRRDGWEGPIVAVTAHAMDADREKCLKAGCDDYVSKPVTSEELFATVARHLNTAATSPATASPSESSARPPSGPPPDPENADLVETFLSGLSTRVENMERALHAGNFSGLGKLAHQLKGTAGGFRFPAIAHTARRFVEQTREGNDLRDLGETLSELRALCKQVVESADRGASDVARHDQPAR